MVGCEVIKQRDKQTVVLRVIVWVCVLLGGGHNY